MAEIKLFQICHEGDLTVDLTRAIQRLGSEPCFDQSWHVWLTEERHAAALVRWLRRHVAADARLLVACSQFTTKRDFLLIRHSITPGADYAELHDAIGRIGTVVDLPFESTFVMQPADGIDVQTLGRALGELCPDDSLMLVGISHDWAYCNSGVSRMHVAAARAAQLRFRAF